MVNDHLEDWVNARHACSAFEVFNALKHGAKSDVEARNELIPQEKKNLLRFKLASFGSEHFTVSRNGNQISASVDFRWSETSISAYDDQDNVIVSGTITLNDDGECRLKIPDRELSFLQFRRRALEDLFFGF